MIKVFRQSFALKTAYRKNAFIYTLKSLPFIGKCFKDSMLCSKPINVIAVIISYIYEFFSYFIGKIIVISLFMAGLVSIQGYNSDYFIQIFMLISLIGGWLISNIFDVSSDKYYALILMRIDANKYIKSNYAYFLIKYFIGYIIALLALNFYINLAYYDAILCSLFVVCIKAVFSALKLKYYQKHKKLIDDNHTLNKILIVVAILLCAAAIVPLLFGYCLPKYVFYGFLVVLCLGAPISLKYIFKYDDYLRLSKNVIKSSPVDKDAKTLSSEVARDSFSKKIKLADNQQSNKEGAAYFNDIFVKRHRSIIMNSAYIVTAILLTFLIAAIVTLKYVPELHELVNQLFLNRFSIFIFIMYMINRGQYLSQAMFVNCDNSMLHYKFFREKKFLLQLFTERLKTIIEVNLIPTTVFMVGLPVLLYMSGGTTNSLDYLWLPICVETMSIFFSVHFLSMYYLLQPYNINIQMKSAPYAIVNFLVYFALFGFMQLQLHLEILAPLLILFCVIYVGIAILAAYTLAPKTFKLRT